MQCFGKGIAVNNVVGIDEVGGMTRWVTGVAAGN